MKGKTSKLVMLLISFAFILLFQFIPAPAGLNQTSMQVIGIFIGIMLMWNFIGTDWPSLLCMAILAIFQIMSPRGSTSGRRVDNRHATRAGAGRGTSPLPPPPLGWPHSHPGV